MVIILVTAHFLGFTPPKTIETREKFLQNFISSWDGPVNSTETRQGWKHARRLPYGTMPEKKYKKATLHLLHIFAADIG